MKASNDLIKAILFDFGGVLAEEGFKNGLNRFAKEQNLKVSNIVHEGMLAVYDSGFVLGKGTSADFWSLLRQRTGLVGADDNLTKRIMDGFVLRQWMMDVVNQLHSQGYITGILSDQTNWLDILDKKYKFYRSFDYVYNSFYKGKGKSDPSVFHDVAVELGIPESTILFIDDDEGNISRASEEGLQVIHYIDKDRFLTELQKTGIDIV